MSDTPDLVSVHLTQQQIELLERLKEQGDFGTELLRSPSFLLSQIR